MAALVHGLPLLLIPVNPLLDQPMISQAVADAGAGIRIGMKAPPDEIRAALLDLTGNGYSASAKALGARLRETPGAINGADHLVSMLR